jgi:hypothetical protein
MEIHIPEMVPIYVLQRMPLPEILRDMKLREVGDFLVSEDEVRGRGPRFRVNRLSGAVYVVDERRPKAEARALKEEEYIRRAIDFVEQQGWTEEQLAKPKGRRFIVASMPVEGRPSEIREYQKSAIVTFQREIEVDGMRINVLGDGGVMEIQMNNDGSVVNAAKVWREIVGEKGRTAAKPYDQAYEEALKELKEPRAHKLDRWTWGYKEAAGNVEQAEMHVVFEFQFVAADPETEIDYPPRVIEIAGHME